jgi:GTP diphosphokinase / guanosine-3',5'-bis(diphosphate) 3'-diphosphatase
MDLNQQNIEPIVQLGFDELFEPYKKLDTASGVSIKKAFEFAYDAHKGESRKSGEPYIIHPVEVATIVSKEIGLGTKSITAALLHDVVEDTHFEVKDIDEQFGTTVARMVDGLTKLSGVLKEDASTQAENFKKLILTLNSDIRVILIKIADRLHNMRTLDSLPSRKQFKIAAETLYLFSPLSHRLGLYSIKSELEDLSFKFRYPEIYTEISKKLDDAKRRLEQSIEETIRPIREKLDSRLLKYEIKGIIKTVPSIYEKINKSGMSFEELHDLFAIRIVFEPVSEQNDKNECWHIYSMVTDIYNPKPERIRDWISNPKANGYQALHLTVMGPDARWVEVQIRTRNMDEIAERGYVAYWKQKGLKSHETVVNQWIKQVKVELDQDQDKDALEFVEEFKLNLFSSEIMVFTHKGHPRKLPENSTILDFAYDIHSDLGDKCIGAKVNHKLVSRDYTLHSGDQVEVLTADSQFPKPDWIDIVVTARAKSRIKSSFKKQRKELIQLGKDLYEELVKQHKLGVDAKEFKELRQHLALFHKDDFYFALGGKTVQVESILEYLKRKGRRRLMRYWQIQFRSGNKEDKVKSVEVQDKKVPFVIDQQDTLPNYTIANCCKPIPGDDVIGFEEGNAPVKIHKRDCPLATEQMTSKGDKLMEARWKTHQMMSFLANVKLKGIDSVGLVNRVTRVISDELSVNMQTIIFTSNHGIFEGGISIYVHNTEDLNNLILKLMKLKGIESVQRVNDLNE